MSITLGYSHFNKLLKLTDYINPNNGKVESTGIPMASNTVAGGVKVGSGLDINSNSELNMKSATNTSIGGVQSGNGLTVDNSGIMNVEIASSTQFGGIKVGEGLSMNSNNSDVLDLKVSTASVLGGIKIGNGLSSNSEGTVDVDESVIATRTFVENRPSMIRIGVVSSRSELEFQVNIPGSSDNKFNVNPGQCIYLFKLLTGKLQKCLVVSSSKSQASSSIVYSEISNTVDTKADVNDIVYISTDIEYSNNNTYPPCPDSSLGVPGYCTCPSGNSGSITYESTTSSYSNTCAPVSCPINSTGSNVVAGCSCDSGYSGSISSSTVSPYFSGSCVEDSITQCEAGKYNNNNICIEVSCPVNSTGTSISSGCSCDSGYSGTIVATSSSPYYSGSCQNCPAGKYNSTAGSTCEDCPENTYSSSAGSNGCLICPMGTNTDGVSGSTACTNNASKETSEESTF